jgi:putative ABC transport system permease protein
VSGLLQDTRHGLRQLRKNPGFSIIVAFTLALGIGAATGMFSLVDGALFRSLPYPHAERLVSVGVLAPIIDGEFLFAGSYLAWKHDQKPFSGFTSSTGVGACDLTEGHPLRLTCAAVESTFLPTFGIQPFLGRNFTPEEDRPNAPRVALLSYGLWQSRFAGDRSILGRTISLDGKSTRVSGVLPPDFEFPTLAHVNALVPEALDETMVQRNELGPVVRVYGRMKPGLGITAAAAALAPQFRRFVESAPPPFRKILRLQVRSLRDLQVHDSRLAAWLLLASALAVLLVNSANAAGLVLVRGIERRHELAVRAALGAGRLRLFRQRLVDNVLLSFAGGALGCVLAWAIVHSFVALAPASIPRLAAANLSGRAVFFASCLSLIAGVLVGALPAIENPALEVLSAAAPVSRRRTPLRQLVLIGQVGTTLVLLGGALLFLHSLRDLQTQLLGMNTQNVVTADITLGLQKYSRPEQRLAFFEELERRLNQLPGMSVAALSDSLPPTEPARTMPFIALHAEGETALSADQSIGGVVGWRSVTPGYFSALGIPLLRGRDFTEQDRRSGPGGIVLNQALAGRLFPGQDALGKTIRFKLDNQHYSDALTVIAVTGNTENQGLGGHSGPEYYVARRRTPDDLIFRYPDSQRISIVVRSPLDAASVSREVTGAIESLDPEIPVSTSTLTQKVYALAQRPRFIAVLLALFAAMASLLAAAGIYGLVSLLVSQSTHEIAIRIALGAEPAAVVRKTVSRVSQWIVVGAFAGMTCLLALSHWLRALLFGIEPNDPITLAEAAVILFVLGLFAAYIPARRAAKVDPMLALRYE